MATVARAHGFPATSLGGAGHAEEIAEFCSATYGCTFPLMEKIEVNGESRHPIYADARRRRTPRARPATSRGTSRSPGRPSGAVGGAVPASGRARGPRSWPTSRRRSRLEHPAARRATARASARPAAPVAPALEAAIFTWTVCASLGGALARTEIETSGTWESRWRPRVGRSTKGMSSRRSRRTGWAVPGAPTDARRGGGDHRRPGDRAHPVEGTLKPGAEHAVDLCAPARCHSPWPPRRSPPHRARAGDFGLRRAVRARPLRRGRAVREAAPGVIPHRADRLGAAPRRCIVWEARPPGCWRPRRPAWPARGAEVGGGSPPAFGLADLVVAR